MNNRYRDSKTKNKVKDILKNKKDIIVFDLETSGLNKSYHRIIEIAGLKLSVDNKFVIKEKFKTYINPGFYVSRKIENLTRITNKLLRLAPKDSDIFPSIDNFFKDYLVVSYNTDFDIGFIKELYKKMGKEFKNKYIDALEIARDIIDIPSYKLIEVAKELKIEVDEEKFHGAYYDSYVTVQVLNKAIEMYDFKDDNKTLYSPGLLSINFWEGYKGFSRIYVETELGSVYYDLRRKSWNGKDVNIKNLDMDYILKECLKYTKTSSIEEFRRFKDSIKLN